MNEDDAVPTRAILALLAARAAGATIFICPSEAARTIDATAWRETMPRVHEAARRLAASGTVVLTQGGAAMKPDEIVGAYRIASATRQRQDLAPAIASDASSRVMPPSSPRE